MTRDTIDTAVREGIPFAINMADGKSYEVREVTKIAIGRTRVVVLDDRDLPHPSRADDDRHQLFAQRKWRQIASHG